MSTRKVSFNVVRHESFVDRDKRQRKNKYKSFVLWFTGLSGAGKSTLAHAIEEEFYHLGFNTYVLDGDNVRHGICGDLGFSDDDRKENIRRIGEISKLFVDAGIITLIALISPFRKDRDQVRCLLGDGDFIEIYCKASLQVCEKRDIKGIYQKARKGIIKNFTGISSPYEEPKSPELIVNTDRGSPDECTQIVINYLKINGYLRDQTEN